MTRIAELHRYPVKSLLGESLAETAVTSRGFPGDRAWAVRDEAAGAITGGKKFPALMSARARFVEPPAEGRPSPPAAIELPDGRSFTTTDPDAARRAIASSVSTTWTGCATSCASSATTTCPSR